MNNKYKFDCNKYKFKNIIKNMYNEYFKCDIILEDIHNILDTDLISDKDKNFYKEIPIFGKNDRDSLFVKIYHNYIDNNMIFNNIYIEFIKDFIKPTFFPNEEYIVLQKTPNIRLHLPNCTNIGKRDTDPNSNIIGLHKDSEFGHDKDELNFILAITDMYDTNSFYYEPFVNSNINYEDYNNLYLNENNIAILYLNQQYHYNKINNTSKTRISFDFRIIPYSKYNENNNISKTNKLKLILGDYFIKI